jgi:hypothetical protein
MLIAARNGHSTAPFAQQCQSFLDNFPAGFGAKGSTNDRTACDRSRGYADYAGEKAPHQVLLPQCWNSLHHAAVYGTSKGRCFFLEIDLTGCRSSVA